MNIHLAGGESNPFRALIREKLHCNSFASFFYFSTSDDFIKHMEGLKAISKCLIIDSGAHSFFAESDTIVSASTHTRKNKRHHDPEAYFKRYIEWCDANRHLYDYFVELDIGEIIGQQRVYEWREEIIRRGLADRCLIVFHPNSEKESVFFKRLNDWPSRYCGLEGIRPGVIAMDYVKVIKRCYDSGIRVHGFAMTKPPLLKRLPFYSVDSSTLFAGTKYARWGGVQDDHRYTSVMFERPKTSRAQNKMVAFALDSEIPLDIVARHRNSTKGIYDEMIRINARAFFKMEDFYRKLWKSRGVDWEKAIRV